MADNNTTTTTTETDPKVLALVESTKGRTFRRDTADKGLAAAKSPKALAAFYVGSGEAFKQADESKSVAAAYMIESGLRLGLPQTKIASDHGISGSTVTLYKRLALAVRKGITPNTEPEAWRLLSSKAIANDKEVAALLTKGDSKADEILPVIDKQWTAKQAKASGGSDSDESGSTTGTSGNGGNQVEVPATFKQRVAMMEAIIAGWSSPSKPLTAKQIEDIEGVGRKLVATLRVARKAVA